MAAEPEICCPPFDPQPWDCQQFAWHDKLFVKDRVRSFLHIPLDFGTVLARNWRLIQAAGAASDDRLVLSDENSLWGADMFIAVAGEVPGARMTRLSGTFLTKVFEGPYKDIRRWIGQMREHVQSQGKTLKSLYFFYTTCPKCAKKLGKNYVVLVAQV